MISEKRFYKKDSNDVLRSVEYFCRYYKTIKKYIEQRKIKSSVDRGAFARPHHLLPEEMLSLLGSDRDRHAFAYGPERGEGVLIDKLCEVENTKFGTTYTNDEVCIVPGAWAGVELVLEELAQLKNGCSQPLKVGVVGPTHYQLFHRAINMLGVEIIGFDFVYPKKQKTITNKDDVDALFKISPDVIFLTNPNNPDGVYLPEKILKQIISRAKKEKIYIMIDEIQDFLRAPQKKLSYGPWIQDSHVIRIDSYSKKRALAEYRTGWVFADKSLLGTRTTGIKGRMSGLMGNAPRAANTLILELKNMELENLDSDKIFQSAWSDLLEKRDFVKSELSNFKKVNFFPREACINLTFNVDADLTDFQLSKRLMEQGTLVMPCSGYGYLPEDTVMRVTFAERWEKIRHAVNSIKKVLHEI